MKKNEKNLKHESKHSQTSKNTKNLSKKVLCIIVLIVLLFLIIFFKDNFVNLFNSIFNTEIPTSSTTSIDSKSNNITDVSSSIEPITFTFTALGDTLCHNTQYWDAYNKQTGIYDFSYVYDDIRSYTEASDITISSLETTFAGEDRGYSNYPTFNTPDSLATALKGIGIDIISTAGNHALDYGYSGLCRSIDVLNNAGLSHLGTYKSAEEQEQILIKDVKGVKIAFINYTYGTNGIPVPSGKEYCVNLIDKELIKKQIAQAKEAKVDMIVACIHWGTEYRTTANSEQKELADFLFKNGVDVIIGNHPHVLEPMEKRTVTLDDGTIKDCFVVYALGNFTADQREEITRDSAILNLTITKNSDGKISIDKVNYVPIYMYKNKNISTKKFKILDIEKTISEYESGQDTSIGSSVYNNLKIQLQKIRSILGNEIN